MEPALGIRSPFAARYREVMAPIGKLDVIAFDCPDPDALAAFYAGIVGGTIDRHEGGDWVVLHHDGGRLAFQRVVDHQPPTWPTGPRPQQAHLDIGVADLDAAEPAVLALGAQRADVQPDPDAFRVYVDPAGHPFCFVLASA
jgi:catechol 2,3-dioxygenase-like lactoylglutathione lyase family enzyme